MTDVGVNATFYTLVNSSCSSCEIQADRSAYWSPLLYFQYTNGSFVEVPHSGSVVYYLGRGPNAAQTVPFPKGFQMLSGDKAARSYDNQTYTWGNATYPGRPIADRVSFDCLPAGPPLAEQPYMFNTTCANGLRAQIHFQTCWNGVDLYKSDNSHVAYLSSIDDGICPPLYPFQLPHLFMETNYAVSQVPNLTAGGQYVFSQGDPTGYGFHADFQNGWDQDVQTEAVNNCLVPDNFGQISYCPSLLASDTNGYPIICPEQPPQIGEKVHGLLDKLPGCINITYGPAAAPAASMTCPTNSPKPSITRTADSLPAATSRPNPYDYYGLSNEQYLGCYNDSASGIRTLNAYSVTNFTVMTVEYCQSLCSSQGYRLSGVEYSQECHCDNYLNPSAVNGSLQCTWNCGGTLTSGNTQEFCGGLGYINIYNNTDPQFTANGSEVNAAGVAAPYTSYQPYPSNYIGCYSDAVSSRTLTGTSKTSTNMTWDYCAAYCASAGGYQYYGIEYSSQCFCGNALNAQAALLTTRSSPSNSTCDMRCSAAALEVCGGSGVLTMFNNTGFVQPASKPSIGKYVTKQCLTDPNTSGRALQGPSTTSTLMTNELCVKFCLGKLMHFAG